MEDVREFACKSLYGFISGVGWSGWDLGVREGKNPRRIHKRGPYKQLLTTSHAAQGF